MENIKITDKSGDKESFTIIPNYIANHSTANDQALYLQMKKYAGDEGQCFATEKTLMKKLAIGKKAYDKSLQYLLKQEWVSYMGLTKGKTRPIKTYRINNIWKLNNEHYRKISSERDISFNEISSESRGDKFQKQHKISAESNIEQYPTKQDILTRRELCFLLKEWNERQTSPIRDFLPENIVKKHSVSKVARLFEEYGEKDKGFGLFLNGLKGL